MPFLFGFQVGGFDRRQDILSFGTHSYSWWLANGFGCRPEYFQNDGVGSSETYHQPLEPEGYYPIRPSR